MRVIAIAVMAGSAATAAADGKQSPPAVVGATELISIAPDAGFVDDPIAHDDKRLAYVVADAADKADLHVVELASKKDTVVDIAKVTLHPIALRLVGSRAFVVGADGSEETAALVELGGKKPGAVVYKLGPAASIAVVMRDGAARAALHKESASKSGTRHDVEIYALETGKRLAAGHVEFDEKNASKSLEFHVNHWSDGMSLAHGIKGGAWSKKEDQRSPDTEATLDIATGKMTTHAIDDLFEQRKRYQVLADAGGTLDFLKMTWDNSAVQIWHGGKAKPVELDQPLSDYDPKSLQGEVRGDGTAWIALRVDPVNPGAVARKKADPEYLDVFRSTPDGKAQRQARFLAPKISYRFGALGDKQLWLLERSSADRGGKRLVVYGLQ